MAFLASWLGIEQPSYLDIGVHHPTFLSNTYLFYRRTCRGVCVEPDPTLISEIKRVRPRDVCLNVGMADRSGLLDFYVIDPPTLNTFSKEDAQRLEAMREGKIRNVVKVELVSPNELMARHFSPWPSIVSVDTEGMEMTILSAIDFSRYRPEMLCIETVDYATQEKDMEVSAFMQTVGYGIYTDTFINTIFVERNAWDRRRPGSASAKSVSAALCA